MLIVTMNDIPGYEVEEVFGEVFGLTVRSRNIASQVGSMLRSIVGGELKGMTTMLQDSRVQGWNEWSRRLKRRAPTPSSRCASTPPSSVRCGPKSVHMGTAVCVRKRQ